MSDPTQPGSPGNSDPRESKLFAASSGYKEILNHDLPPASQRVRSPGGMATMSARRERRLKNSKLRRNLLIALSIAIGLVLALVATDTIKLGTGPQPSLSKSIESSRRTVTTTVTQVAGEQIETIREYSHSDPLRVYVAGDSLVGSFGQDLATQLGELGTIKATYDSRPSSGLVNEGFFDWYKHARTIVSQYDPELVVFMIGTNDASIVSSNPNGYADAYEEKIKDFIDVFSANKTQMAFVLAPSMRDDRLDANLAKLDAVISTVASENKASVFDSESVLSPSYRFTNTLKLAGKSVVIRASDGVHISGKGGELLSDALYSFLERNYAINRYTSDVVIKASKVTGCCSAPRSSTPTYTSSKSSSTSTSTSKPVTTSPVSSTTTAVTTSIPTT